LNEKGSTPNPLFTGWGVEREEGRKKKGVEKKKGGT